MAKHRQRRYTDEEIGDGLMAVALHNGSPAKAARALKEAGRPIPRETLQRWVRREHPERYAKARDIAASRVWPEIADLWRDTGIDAADAAREAIVRMREATEKGQSAEANRWAGASKAAATTGGISVDKASLIEARPTHIHSRQEADLPTMLRTLATRFPAVFPGLKDSPLIEATAVEEIPTQDPDAEHNGDPESAPLPRFQTPPTSRLHSRR